jgi:hypothetical protein
MYYDLNLKFVDQAQADAALFEEQTAVQGDVVETFKRPRYAAIDVIGTIYKPTGKMVKTDEGAVPVMAPVEGWHVNVRHAEEMPELKAWAVTPKTPSRVWA